jgi:phosphopentomutase
LKRVIILVLDALGIGAMQDVPRTRPRDAGANTLLHLLEWAERDLDKPLSLPNLARLSLGKVLEHSILSKDADGSGTVVGSAALGYPGADSYIAHQTMMGSDMTAIGLEPFSELEQLVAEALVAAGHEVRRALPDLPVLLVDGCMVVGDNLEADPGLNYNVTGSLELTSFDHILSVARIVRRRTPVSRVIAVGGMGLDAPGLVSKLRGGEGEVYGIDTPATGFYKREGLRVLHMGTDLDRSRQLPTLAVQAGLPVTLIGKMADVIDCPEAENLSCVPTEEVLTTTLGAIREKPEGLIGVNVQEIDLAGHQQDSARCAHILALADRGVGMIIDALAPDDLLLVLGDHGNDPTIGHPFHTREYVPILAFSPSFEGSRQLQERRATLGDVGATAAAALRLPVDRLEVGVPIQETVHDPVAD